MYLYKISLTLSVLLAGLISGLFFGFACSVVPGLGRLTSLEYLVAMQSINRAILNPWFLSVFLLPIVLIPLTSYFAYRFGDQNCFILTCFAAALYLIGVFGITAAGNVPLNEMLENQNLAAMNNEQLMQLRLVVEKSWNSYHLMRTVFSVMSFTLLTLGMYPSRVSSWILTSSIQAIHR